MPDSIPVIQSALNAGEIAPQMWGRVDLDKYKKGCSTVRNMFPSYRGCLLSRPGTAFVGQCKQPVSGGIPPQLIPFQFSANEGIVIEAGGGYLRFVINGAYVTETAFAVTGATNGGVFTIPGNNFSPGDWVTLASLGGMTQVNGRTFIVAPGSGTTSVSFVSTLTGAGLDTSNYGTYTSGGTAARVYTKSTSYVIGDIQTLKWSQSADVMSLCHPSYAPADLARITNSSWTLVNTSFATSLSAPTSCTANSSSPTTSDIFYYQYVATAVNGSGEESEPSTVGFTSSVNIAAQAGSILVTCGSSLAAASYNFYRGPVTFNSGPILGALFGYVGSSFGNTFTDGNIVPDYTKTPPQHRDPFAPAQVTSIQMGAGGTGYNPYATTVTITSGTGGTGFAGYPIVVGGAVIWIVTTNAGTGYSTSDTVNIVDGTGSGTGAFAAPTVAPRTGTYPSVVGYFQQRRVYAGTLNKPDTFWASQPGSFTNMDVSSPTLDSDAITGTPWAQQVNGIQWMVSMPGGLVILTGLGAWQLSGAGSGPSATTAITPSNEVATPQAYNGISPLIRPLTINYDILYVQEKGSTVRDLAYNFFVNVYTGTDLTVLSSHLFDNHTIQRWDWSEEPNKLVWAVRDDGILLCLTYLKEQDVYAWSRHDTNGLFRSVCCVSEPPVNAPYFIVQRLILGHGNPTWAYYLERMDNREWTQIEDSWCVDSGLSYMGREPAATLTASSAVGTPTLTQPTLITGGANYGAGTYARIVDPTGIGALLNVTVVAGVVTTITATGTLTGYSGNPPTIVFVDPTGTGLGAQANIGIYDAATVSASAAVFANTAGSGAAGDVIRAGGGVMSVVTYGSSTSLTVNITRPISRVVQNDPNDTPVPQTSGTWTIAAPTAVVAGLDHLEGMLVSILADGVIVDPQVVSGGQVTLPFAATAIVVGLGFTAQMQTLYLDVQQPTTVQGRRKTLGNIAVRVEGTPGPFEVGANQPDASIQPDGRTIDWANMGTMTGPFPGQNPLQPFTFFTGDVQGQVQDQLGASNGQVAIQERFPVPLNILAVIPEVMVDDD